MISFAASSGHLAIWDRRKITTGKHALDLIYIAILVLAVFIAVWVFVVVPAERRHHKRKLEIIEKKIADREAARQANTRDDS